MRIYKVQGILNPRRTVWAVECTKCGKEIRLGGGSKAGIERLLALYPALCNSCLSQNP